MQPWDHVMTLTPREARQWLFLVICTPELGVWALGPRRRAQEAGHEGIAAQRAGQSHVE